MKIFILRTIVTGIIFLCCILLYLQHSENENLLKIISLPTPSKILSVIYEKKNGEISNITENNDYLCIITPYSMHLSNENKMQKVYKQLHSKKIPYGDHIYFAHMNNNYYITQFYIFYMDVKLDHDTCFTHMDYFNLSEDKSTVTFKRK